MKDEIFDVAFTYNGKEYKVTVKTDLPHGPEPFGCDYDIYQGRKLWYVLNQYRNEDDVECWEAKRSPKEGYEPGLVEAIGKAIDNHFG